jgi:hypothetical protein
MPTVEGKKFPYTKAGIAAAKKAAKKNESSESKAEKRMGYGSKTKPAAKVGKVMREYKGGTLHSGKGGPVVKSRKQAVAIAMSQAGMAKKSKKK